MLRLCQYTLAKRLQNVLDPQMTQIVKHGAKCSVHRKGVIAALHQKMLPKKLQKSAHQSYSHSRYLEQFMQSTKKASETKKRLCC